jgi:hypothetical protein
MNNIEQFFMDEMIKQEGVFIQKNDVLVDKINRLYRVEDVSVDSFAIGEEPRFLISYSLKNHKNQRLFQDLISNIKINLGNISDIKLKEEYPEYFI